MVTSVDIYSTEVLQVKHAVEARFGMQPKVPSDFDALSLAIEQHTHRSLNSDTLRRIWGYKTGYKTVRKTTLSILLSYACAHIESNFVYHDVVQTADREVGDQLQLAWLPDRICTIEYIGDWRWKVVSVQNSKLQVGDTFACRVFVPGNPLLIDNLYTNNHIEPAYEIGKQSGLSMVKVLPRS